MLRNGPSRRATRVRAIRRAASTRFSGGMATAKSRSTSAIVPPAPKEMTGPNTGSDFTPAISSRMSRPAAMRSSVTPRISASGRALRTSR